MIPDITHIINRRRAYIILILCLVNISLGAQCPPSLPDNIVEADCFTTKTDLDWGIVQSASSQPLSHMYAQPFIGDIDNDGQSEIVTMGYYNATFKTKSIVIYGQNLQLKNSFTVPTTYVLGGYPMAIADVDRDGIAEIFVQGVDSGYLRCYHPDGTLLWTSTCSEINVNHYTTEVPNIIIADVNSDHIPEIWSNYKIFNAVTGAELLVLPDLIGYSNLNASYWENAIMPVFADFDNDGMLELVGGKKVYKLDITNSNGTMGNSAVLWKTIDGVGDGLTSVADIDLDGYLDVVVVQDGLMYVWKPYTGTGSTPTLLASSPYTSPVAGSRALITDVDNDGYPEILFSYATKITAYQFVPTTQSLQQLWLKNSSDHSGATTMTAFDFNQDGLMEIVYRDQTDLRIIDGITGENKATIACPAPTDVECAAIVDLDKDGEAEIIVSSCTEGNHAKIVVFKSSSHVIWAPARHVWNQHAYNVVNVHDDLTIPAYNFNPATIFTDPEGLVRRPFNNFLQQATTLDQYGRPFIPATNLAITPEPEVTLAGEEARIALTLCNNGDLDFYAPIAISLYTNMGEMVQTEYLAQSLHVGECESLNLTFDLSGLSDYEDLFPLHIMVNDDGDGPAQYGGLQAECDTSDNAYYFDGRPCNVIVPNVITPNGDGINDVWEPQLEGDFHSMEMEIYNRWGKRVYRQEGVSGLSWDAAGLPDGVYFCAIEYQCMLNSKKKKSLGTSVTVVR